MDLESGRLSPAVRELLELWDEQLLSVWLEARLKSEWQWHAGSGVAWPVPTPPQA
jgi:hypothetical protein